MKELRGESYVKLVNLLVTGLVPPGSGVLSSAAMVAASTLTLHITFYPMLCSSPVLLLHSHTFVIAHSLVVSDKATTVKHKYNAMSTNLQSGPNCSW